MRTFAQLGTAHRNEPCVEYPGKWLVFINGNDDYSFPTRSEALKFARTIADGCIEAPVGLLVNEHAVHVGWEASHDDPRIGETWFTSFYLDTEFR